MAERDSPPMAGRDSGTNQRCRNFPRGARVLFLLQLPFASSPPRLPWVQAVCWVLAVLGMPFMAPCSSVGLTGAWGTPAGAGLFGDLVFTISSIFGRTCGVAALTVPVVRRGK